jgi:hypothetical protein
MNRTHEPFNLGARLDYSANTARRQAEGLADGAAIIIEVDGGPLSIRRLGAGFHVTGAGQPDDVLTSDDMAAVVWSAVLAHVQRRQAAAASHAKGTDDAKAA